MKAAGPTGIVMQMITADKNLGVEWLTESEPEKNI